MPLNIDIDALALRDNQIVLAGNRSEETRIDAGLFVTALRTACLSSDPYFSLDPVNSAAWSDAQPSPDTAHKLEDSILTRARELRLASLGNG